MAEVGRTFVSADGKSITCGRCGMTSHNLNDVKNRYCGNCHIFHDDVIESVAIARVIEEVRNPDAVRAYDRVYSRHNR